MKSNLIRFSSLSRDKLYRWHFINPLFAAAVSGAHEPKLSGALRSAGKSAGRNNDQSAFGVVFVVAPAGAAVRARSALVAQLRRGFQRGLKFRSMAA